MTPFPTFAAWSLLALLAAASPAQQDIAFKVGTWNLEFLGAPGPQLRKDTPPRGEDDYVAIGRKVVELGVAVLAVQEVNDEATLQQVAAGAGASWKGLLGTTGTWDDGKTAQRVGFLWDSAQVELLHAEELLQLPRRFDGQPIFHRVPVTACFRHGASGCDFRLVTVHLKAGQKALDEHKRRGEATELAAWLDALANDPREDPDVLLLGDFNSSPGADTETLLEASGMRSWLEPRTKGPTILHFADPIDHVVAAARCAEVRRDSLACDDDCDGLPREQWRKVYSDHFPVTVTLAARGDDDAEATFTRGPAAQWLPASTRAATTAQDRTTPWPPRIGTTVAVTTGRARHEGRLLQDVPAGPGGWLVLELRDGEVIALPFPQIETLRVRSSARTLDVAGTYVLDKVEMRTAMLAAMPAAQRGDAAVAKMVDEMLRQMEATVELRPDHSAHCTMRMGLGGADQEETVAGSWKLADGKLTITVKDKNGRDETKVADWADGAFTVAEEMGGKRTTMTFRRQ
jgi:endonuclease/exonuclease/phosphatase family metal-dependent hydrolase